MEGIGLLIRMGQAAEHGERDEEDRGAQHARFPRRHPLEQASDQGRRQESVRRLCREGQHPHPVSHFVFMSRDVLLTCYLDPTARRRRTYG